MFRLAFTIIQKKQKSLWNIPIYVLTSLIKHFFLSKILTAKILSHELITFFISIFKSNLFHHFTTFFENLCYFQMQSYQEGEQRLQKNGGWSDQNDRNNILRYIPYKYNYDSQCKIYMWRKIVFILEKMCLKGGGIQNCRKKLSCRVFKGL